MKRKRTKQRINNCLRAVTWFLIIPLSIVVILLTLMVRKLGVLPGKYMAILYVVMFLVLVIPLLLSYILRRKNAALITISIISIILFSVFTFGFIKINEIASFLSKNLEGNKTEIVEYSIVSNIYYQYEDIDDIKRKDLYMPENSEHKEVVEEKVKELTKGKIIYESNESDLIEHIKEDTNKLVIIKKPFYDAFVENDKTVKDNTKELARFTINVDAVVKETTKDVSKDPFILYISGIDTRANELSMYSLSDVNMLVAINPNTKDVLMVHIPRDYFVQLHGTTGQFDKLTHAGLRGGVQLSIDTIQDFMDIDIDHYLKVNFQALIKLVDAVGGINIYNDLNESFVTFNDQNCTINPGNNYVYGKCALAFARERFVYESGDIHRGQNQQQVMERLIDKISGSRTLITNYSQILEALNGSFATSLTQEDISGLVKGQLENMSKWNISKYNITGFNGSDYTYSFPRERSYVMLQNPEKIAEAKAKINEVLNKKVS